ncbi:hypothetical protein WKR88_07600 [Trinickia caryophylli]|uniref:Uncharacterized protein n=1 Tax=Trinickia caryophylli TaxID=28094 RepID=A0A1X7EB15_TRICW|nr:hypothetical protein [Trinickia caryophylli]PMS12983.1 hypothetical protein C0Z17_06750 [Trinickia caryophylli]TRX14744.1 hypothetical protein FNF07_26245 [Trinickia caryophylli]WQE14589.1 hypothetical protein U0034_28435 [Trinickia caryophylli]SMF30338.1 hypothetical protein SAMN06295900_105112 [Trinickia caryophylli]GLU31996.1 hypothetical protein Busp01_18380 [Trinickia caryophylli]
MTTTGFHLYRGLEVYPLVYPHRATEPGRTRNYDEGFDAAVRIQEPKDSSDAPRSRVFRLAASKPFQSAGDARRASMAYAEHLIDACPSSASVLDSESEVPAA